VRPTHWVDAVYDDLAPAILAWLCCSAPRCMAQLHTQLQCWSGTRVQPFVCRAHVLGIEGSPCGVACHRLTSERWGASAAMGKKDKVTRSTPYSRRLRNLGLGCVLLVVVAGGVAYMVSPRQLAAPAMAKGGGHLSALKEGRTVYDTAEDDEDLPMALLAVPPPRPPAPPPLLPPSPLPPAPGLPPSLPVRTPTVTLTRVLPPLSYECVWLKGATRRWLAGPAVASNSSTGFPTTACSPNVPIHPSAQPAASTQVAAATLLSAVATHATKSTATRSTGAVHAASTATAAAAADASHDTTGGTCSRGCWIMWWRG
jgi:hypothetical protein